MWCGAAALCRGELFRARLVNQVWDHASASGPVTKYDDPIGLVTFTNVETGEEITVRSFGGVRTRMRWPDGSLWDEEKRVAPLPGGFMVGGNASAWCPSCGGS